MMRPEKARHSRPRSESRAGSRGNPVRSSNCLQACVLSAHLYGQGGKTRAAGFTLLEVLVALVLLSVFSLTAYQGLDTVLAAERQALGEMARWRGLARAFTRINNDLRATLPGTLGAGQPGFVASARENGDWRIAFDRQITEDEGGGLRRVEYRYEGGELNRIEGQVATPLLTGLRVARIGFLDRDGAWLPTWPDSGTLPRALALDLDWTRDSAQRGLKLRRVFLAS